MSVPGTLGTAVGIPLPRSVLVLEVQGSGLAYRGALIVQSNGTPRYEAPARGQRGAPPRSVRPDRCRGLAHAQRAMHQPAERVPAVSPAGDADRRAADADGHRRADAGPAVAVPLGAWGIDDAGSAHRPGPVPRPTESGHEDDAPAWQIVARYDPSRSVRVVIP